MPRRNAANTQLTQAAQKLWQLSASWPPEVRYGLLALALVAGLGLFLVSQQPSNSTPNPEENNEANQPATGLNEDGSGTFLFCTWNVENLFDDKVDKGRRAVDKPFDEAFGEDEKLRQEKLDQIASALLKMNGGKGPDVLACMEVESVRAADLLRATLNRHLDEAKADPKLKYTQVAMKNIGNDAGRHIAPAIITRLNVSHPFTKFHGRNLRVLETRLFVNGYELCIIASHWTSQLRQRDGSDGDSGRSKYGDTVFSVYETLFKKNPKVDFLVCGDFNDIPEAEPLTKHLHAIGDKQKVLESQDPLLLNLLYGKPGAQFGTLYYGGKPLIYDHICVSPGLLDEAGWSVDPDSVKVPAEGLIAKGATRREPWRFGDPNNAPKNGRGFSDHFPVTVTLKVQAPVKKDNKPD